MHIQRLISWLYPLKWIKHWCRTITLRVVSVRNIENNATLFDPDGNPQQVICVLLNRNRRRDDLMV